MSYSHKDKSKVLTLSVQLKERGLNVWLDEWVIQPGDDIYLKIEKGLEMSHSLILCMSKAAFGSDWLALERSTVIFRDPTNLSRRFIPLLLEDCEIPHSLKRFLYIDGRMLDENTIQKLVEACRLPKATDTRPEQQIWDRLDVLHELEELQYKDLVQVFEKLQNLQTKGRK